MRCQPLRRALYKQRDKMKLITNGLDFSRFNDWKLVVNDEEYSLEDCTLYDEGLISVSTNFTGGKSITTNEIKNIKPSEFPQYLHLTLDGVEDSFHRMIYSLSVYKLNENLICNFAWGEQFSNWDESYNLLVYKKYFLSSLSDWPSKYLKEVTDDSGDYKYYSDSADVYLTYEIPVYDFQNLEGVFNHIRSELLEVEELTKEELLVDGLSNKLISKFNFPPEYETYCVKYLQYFVEFLKDMGINAQSSLIVNSGQTLFSVEPTDKDVSLSSLHDALGLYLCLPTQSDLISADNADILTQMKIEKLNFEVTSLKSALRLKDAMLFSYENSTQMVNVQNHSVVINGSLESVVVDGKKEQPAEFFDGIVKLGVYKVGPLELDVGRIANKLKQLV